MKLRQYLTENQEPYVVIKDYMQLGKDEFDKSKIQHVHTQQEKTERTGRNWVGNIYKKKWVSYFLEPSKKSMNTIHGKPYNIKIIFNTKKDMTSYI